MASFLPIADLDATLTLSPEFYVANETPASKSNIIALVPPLTQEDVIANSCLLALFDSGIAMHPLQPSFSLLEIPKTASNGQQLQTSPFRTYSWSGRTLNSLSVHPRNLDAAQIRKLVEGQGIVSRTARQTGLMGAISNLSGTVSSIEGSSFDSWPFVLFPVSADGELSLSLSPDDAVALTDVLGEPAEEKHGGSGITPEIKKLILEILPDCGPHLAIVRLSEDMFGAEYYLACLCSELSRDTLVPFLDALAERIQEQRGFAERCRQIIGTEISSRIRHMFKNRIGSAYDEIQSISRVATEKGWLSTVTEPDEVIKIQKELHQDAEDYYQVGAHLGRIRQNLKSLERAVDQLSKFYRGTQGAPELVSINQAIETQLAIWHAARADVKILKDLDSVDPVSRIVPDALAEILDNILLNSKHFIPREPGHHIFITTKLVREKLVISIANDGPYELPDHPTKLFVTTDPQGTGVGLHLVERLVSEAGGAFSIYPRRDGPGVVNWIELPNPKWKEE